MITLSHLQVRDFKSLREVELTFPRQASILIEGLNEAGKSSLFEAVYFALYGEPLLTEETGSAGRGSNESAINYSANEAIVNLELDVDGTLIQVERRLRKGKSAEARLYIQPPGKAKEQVNKPTAVNERMISELGKLDKEALLNSCFVEQKKLSKLEDLNGTDRRNSLEKLLNLDKLQTLQNQFKISRQDEDELRLAETKLNLALAQARIPTLELELVQTRQALTAVAIRELLDELDRQYRSLKELLERKAQLEIVYTELQQKLQQVGTTELQLGQLRGLIEVRQELDRLDAQAIGLETAWQELKLKEQEELPRLQKRLEDLTQLKNTLEGLALINQNIAELQTKIREANTELGQITKQIEARQVLEAEIEKGLAEVEQALEKLQSEELTATAMLKSLGVRRTLLEELAGLLKSRQDLVKQKLEVEQTAKNQQAEYKQLLARLEEADKAKNASDQEAEQQLLDYDAAYQNYQKHTETAKQHLEALRQQRENLGKLTTLRRELDDLEKDFGDLKGKLAVLDQLEQTELPKLQVRLSALEQLQSALQAQATLEQNQSTNRRQIEACRVELDQIASQENLSQSLALQIAETEAEIQMALTQIEADETEAKQNLERLNRRKALLQELSRLLEAQQKLEAERLEMVEAVEVAKIWQDEHQRLIDQLEEAYQEERLAKETLERQEEDYTKTQHSYQESQEAAALEKWRQGQRDKQTLIEQKGSLAQLRQELGQYSSELVAETEKLKLAQQRPLLPAAVAVLSFLIALIGEVLGLTWRLILVVIGLVCSGVAAFYFKAIGPQQQKVADISQKLDSSRQQQIGQETRLATLESFGGGSGALDEAETILRGLGVAVPSEVAEVENRLASLSPVASPTTIAQELETKRVELNAGRSHLLQLNEQARVIQEKLNEHFVANKSPANLDQVLSELISRQNELSQQIELKASEVQITAVLILVNAELDDLEKELDWQKARIAALPSRRDNITLRQDSLQGQQQKWQEIENWLKEHQREAVEVRLTTLEAESRQLEQSHNKSDIYNQQQATELGVQAQSGSVQEAQGAAKGRMVQIQDELDQRPAILQQFEEVFGKLAPKQEQTQTAWDEWRDPETAIILPATTDLLELDNKLNEKLQQATYQLEEIEASFTEVEAKRSASEKARSLAATNLALWQAAQKQVDQHPVAKNILVEYEQKGEELALQIEQLTQQIELKATEVKVEPFTEAVVTALTELEAEIRQQNDILAALPARLETVATRQAYLEGKQQELEGLKAWLQEHNSQKVEQQLQELTQTLEQRQQEAEQIRLQAEKQAGFLDVLPQIGIVQQAEGATRKEREGLETELKRQPELLNQQQELKAKIEQKQREGQLSGQPLIEAGLLTEGLPDATVLDSLNQALLSLLQELDEPKLLHQKAELDQQKGEIGKSLQNATSSIGQSKNRITELLKEQNLSAEPTAEAISEVMPIFSKVAVSDRAEVEGKIQGLNIDLETTRRTCKDLGLKLSLDSSVLDVAECETVLAERRQALEVKKRAEKLIKITRARMVDKVLPNTERNLCLLLPLLTLDRYRDCRITSDYKLQIWDEQAARYVAKNIFSGGTRDQFSLALRLAFALATLPEELGTTPGFIFLDEPLSSFDSLRTQALVRLLTQGQIATNFSQIFVISHSQMFDRSAFTHHLRMENGRVAEHDFKRSARPLS